MQNQTRIQSIGEHPRLQHIVMTRRDTNLTGTASNTKSEERSMFANEGTFFANLILPQFPSIYLWFCNIL